jgi:hypothetical protein
MPTRISPLLKISVIAAITVLLLHPAPAQEKSKSVPSQSNKIQPSTPSNNQPDPVQIAGIEALKHFLPEIAEQREKLGFKPNDDLDELTIGNPIPVLLLNPEKNQNNYTELFTPTQDYWFSVRLRGTPKAIVTITKDETGYVHNTFGFCDFATGLDPILDIYQNTNPLFIVLSKEPIAAYIKIDGLKYQCLMPIPTTTQTGIQLAKKPTPAEAILKTFKPLNPDIQPFP